MHRGIIPNCGLPGAGERQAAEIGMQIQCTVR